MAKIKEGNHLRRNIMFAKAMESGAVETATKTMGEADKKREIHQAHLAFVTELINGGVKEAGIEWLDNDGEHYSSMLLRLAEIRGLTVTHEMLKERFADQGLVDIDKELEGDDADQINQPLTLHEKLNPAVWIK